MKKTSDKEVPADLSKAAVYGNSFRSAAPWARSTGFRAQSLRHRALSYSGQPRLAEEFLINTRLVRSSRESEASIEAYFSDGAAVMLSKMGEEAPSARRSLPKSPPLRMELGEAIARRRSCRSYTGDPIELEDLAALLRGAAGITGRAEAELAGGVTVPLHFRATPSGGGLYTIDVYVAAARVNGLGRGVYRYNPTLDALVEAGTEGDLDALLRCFSVPDEVISVSRAGAVFLLVGHPWKAMRKYGDRGMRFVFMEAGAIAEHINLASGALGLGSVDCASIYDDEVHQVMNLDGLYRSLIHTVVVGNPG